MKIPYEGGPVVFCPLVYTSFWGPSWKAENAGLATQLNQFIQDLLAATPWMNTLTQYGVSGTGAFMQASYVTDPPSTLTVADYENLFELLMAGGVIPVPTKSSSSGHTSPQVMMVFLDPNVEINDPAHGRQLNVPNSLLAGYHDSFTVQPGIPCIYAFSEFADIDTITTVMSHEFAEMITDPLYNAWTPDHAGTEIGDPCESAPLTTITVSGRTWTVQEIWSDAVNACVASSASKITPISPGPGGMLATGGVILDRRGRGPAKAPDPIAVDAADVLPFHRVLPLPSVHFSHATREKRIDDADMRAYARRLFSPLRHEHLFDDFPAFLRQGAAVLEAQGVPADGAAAHLVGNGETGDEAASTAPSEVLVAAAPLRRQGVASKPRGGAKQTANTT